MSKGNEPTGADALAALGNIPQLMGNMAVQLTKRELIAAMAMQGLLSGMAIRQEVTDKHLIAACAVVAGDALLAELEKSK